MSIEEKQLEKIYHLPEMVILTEKERRFVIELFNTNFNASEAMRRAYGRENAATESTRTINKPKIAAAISVIRNFYLSSFDWNFEESWNFALRMLYICKGNTDQNVGRHRAQLAWMKAAQFWKENLDRMHGYYTENIKTETRILIKELEMLPREELLKLAKMKTSAEMLKPL
jgi:hypothetical protein